MKYLIAWLWLFTWPAYAIQVEPPAYYDHEFAGEVIVTEISMEQRLRKICEGFGANFQGQAGMACAFTLRGKCFIFTLSDRELELWNYDAKTVLRHERAHCNGWPNDHPRNGPAYQLPK